MSDDATNIVAQAHAVETAATHVSPQDNLLLRELLKPGADIRAVIPDDVDANELWRVLNACSSGLKMLEQRSARLKPIIGRILLMFENKPSLYKELGYETYTDFIKHGVYEQLGLHATAAWEAKKVATDWPQLTPDEYPKIGPKKLNIISKFTTGRSANAATILDVAKRMKVPELREYCEQRGLVAPGETQGAVITIRTNQNIYSHFKKFFGDGRVHSVVGSSDHGAILEAMMQENFDDWIAKHEEARRAR